MPEGQEQHPASEGERGMGGGAAKMNFSAGWDMRQTAESMRRHVGPPSCWSKEGGARSLCAASRLCSVAQLRHDHLREGGRCARRRRAGLKKGFVLRDASPLPPQQFCSGAIHTLPAQTPQRTVRQPA